LKSINELSFVDLFAGCGGLSLGLLQAGWKGVFAIEKNRDAFKTFRSNLIENEEGKSIVIPKFDRWPKWLDVKEWDIGEFLSLNTSMLKKFEGKVDLLAGGPPCQGFSIAGKRNRTDPRNQLFREYLKVVYLLKPSLLLIENVEGMKIPFVNNENGKVETYSTIIKNALENLDDEDGNDCSYHVEQDVVLASNFGVPQVRPRLITIAFSKAKFEFPPKNSFRKLSSLRTEFLKSKGLPTKAPVTIAQALSDINRCRDVHDCIDQESPRGYKEISYRRFPGTLSRYQSLMRTGLVNGYQPDSLRLVNHKKETIQRFKAIQSTCRKGVQLSDTEKKTLRKRGIKLPKKHQIVPLSGNQACHTITTIPDDLLHYEQPRVHTVRENARIQSFPDWFSFKGKYTTGGDLRKKDCPRYSQVANAVPPLLAEAVGLLLRQIFLDEFFEEGKQT
jgi:DNA (cytosine-5)-methyltransferase 1